MSEYDMFKTTLMGGYDKEDVILRFQNLKDDNFAEQKKLKIELQEKEIRIEELKTMIDDKNRQIKRLEEEIDNKYKKYADNYDNIGKLVFDAQVKSDRMLHETQAKCEAMIGNTKDKCQQVEAQILDASKERAQKLDLQIEAKLEEGKRRYSQIQEEINHMIEIMNHAQNRFMSSYKEIHHIVNGIPDALEVNDDAEGAEELDELLEDGFVSDTEEFQEDVLEEINRLDAAQDSQEKVKENKQGKHTETGNSKTEKTDSDMENFSEFGLDVDAAFEETTQLDYDDPEKAIERQLQNLLKD